MVSLTQAEVAPQPGEELCEHEMLRKWRGVRQSGIKICIAWASRPLKSGRSYCPGRRTLNWATSQCLEGVSWIKGAWASQSTCLSTPHSNEENKRAWENLESPFPSHPRTSSRDEHELTAWHGCLGPRSSALRGTGRICWSLGPIPVLNINYSPFSLPWGPHFLFTCLLRVRPWHFLHCFQSICLLLRSLRPIGGTRACWGNGMVLGALTCLWIPDFMWLLGGPERQYI